MKNTFNWLVLGLFAFSLNGWAASPKRQIASHPVTTTSGAETGHLWVGPSLLIVDGEVGFGIPIAGYWHITHNPLYIGFESGFNHFGFTGGSINAIPMMVSGYYKIPIEASSMTFLAGLSMGMTLEFLSTKVTLPAGVSTTKAYFEMLFEPGLMVPASDMLLIFQPKFGVLGGDFTFQPTASISFAI